MTPFDRAHADFNRALRLGAPKAILSRRYDALKDAYRGILADVDELGVKDAEGLNWAQGVVEEAYVATCRA